MSDRPRFPHAQAMAVAEEILAVLAPGCVKAVIAGSLRRQKPTVGDIEILYVPAYRAGTLIGLFGYQGDPVNSASMEIDLLILKGSLAKRLNAKGREMYGEKNKFLVHVASGIPVDLFATTELCWSNYLVCRTGSSETNVRICNAAIAHGWKWNPYDAGFSRGNELYTCHSEEEVFAFVGLPYLKPEER